MDARGAIVAERDAFAETLEVTEPDAPTLAGSWTAAEVVAHVVSLDRMAGIPAFVGRTVVSRSGFRLNDAASRFADRSIRSTMRNGFEWAVTRLRSSPPALLVRPSVAPVGLFEVFTHHEDVRRGHGQAPPRAAPAELVSALPWLLRYQRRRLRGVRIRLIGFGGSELSVGEGPDVTVEGELSEVVLWLAGRKGAANVRIGGDEAAVDMITRAAIRV